MKEGNLESERTEFYPSKARFWFILIWGAIVALLGVKLFNIEVSKFSLSRNNSVAFIVGWGSIALIAWIIEITSVPKKMILKNSKKYIIIFIVFVLLAYGITYSEPKILLKSSVLFCIIFGVTMVCHSIYRLIIKRPSIILSQKGIVINSESNFYGIKMIYWNEIEEVFVYNNYLKRTLGIKVNNMKEIKKRQSFIGKIYSLPSGHVSIFLGFLEGDNDYLEREIMRYVEKFKV